MSSTTVHLIVPFHAKAGCEQALADVLAGLIEPTRAEAGCIRYELLQGVEDPAKLFFVEEWQDEDALEAHRNSPHLQAAVEQFDRLCSSDPHVTFCRMV